MRANILQTLRRSSHKYNAGAGSKNTAEINSATTPQNLYRQPCIHLAREWMSKEVSDESRTKNTGLNVIILIGLGIIIIGTVLFFLDTGFMDDYSSTPITEKWRIYGFGITFIGIGLIMYGIYRRNSVDDDSLFITSTIGLLAMLAGSIIYLLIPTLIELRFLNNWGSFPPIEWYERSGFWYAVGWGLIIIGLLSLSFSIMIVENKPNIQINVATKEDCITSSKESDT
jgi:hypothetical protein